MLFKVHVQYFIVITATTVHGYAVPPTRLIQLPPTGSTHLFVKTNFDFSSSTGWDAYYQEDDSVVEWHSSIPLETIADFVTSQQKNCLVVGCGNSLLPRVILQRNSNIEITCMDSSQTCLDQLRIMFHEYNPDLSCIKFVCGDAVMLTNQITGETFDCVVDKGLVDALMCGEGWNGPVARLMEEVAKVLNVDGYYVLVCYKLSTSTKEFLKDLDKDLSWNFDLEGSNDRVSISMATKI